MSRPDIPPALASYMQGNGLHMGHLTKVGPLPDGSYRYFSHQTKSYTYDDGTGPQTYVGRTGMEVSAFVSATDLSVDNAEMNSLASIDGFPLEGFTTAQVASGALDGVEYVTYCVNYTNLSLGHFVWSAGTIGEQRIRGTAIINLEQRSISNKLKQVIVRVDSRACRAPYGSQPYGSSDSSGPVVEDREWCGIDLSTRWSLGTVSDVPPTDSDKTFYSTSFSAVDGAYRRGMVRALTGPNFGQEREIEEHSVDSAETTITVLVAFPFPFEVGDQVEVRDGCDKSPNACRDSTRWGTAWTLHFRGEPWQPVGDAGIVLVGGPAVPGDLGGTGENPTTPPVNQPVPNPGGAGTPGSPPARTIGATVSTPSLTTGTAGASANSTAINNAIAGLPAGGGIVRIPAGTWYINTANPITLNADNTRLDLETNNAVLRAAYSSTVTAPATHRDVVRVDGATEWEIVGGNIIGYLDDWVSNGGTSVHGVSEWAHGIFVTGGSSAGTIKNISISRCVGDGISIGYSASIVYVDNAEIVECRRQGISSGGDSITIANCNIGYIGTIQGTSPMAGIDIEVDSPESANTIVLQDNNLHHNRGPGLICWLRTSNITIDGNTIEDNQNYGILIHDSDTGTITGNTIRRNKYDGIRLESNADGWTVGGTTGSSSDKNTCFSNNSAQYGTHTSGNTATITGQSSLTNKHVEISSDSTVTMLYNDYGPA